LAKPSEISEVLPSDCEEYINRGYVNSRVTIEGNYIEEDNSALQEAKLEEKDNELNDPSNELISQRV
jgi:hypothetical protein